MSRQYASGGASDPYATSGRVAIALPGPSDAQRDRLDDRQPVPPTYRDDDNYEQDEEPYYDEDPRTSRQPAPDPARRPRVDPAPARQPTDPAAYYDDRRDGRTGRGDLPAGGRPRDGYDDAAQYGDDSRQLKVELDDMVGQMDALRAENEEMHLRLRDSEKRSKEVDELKERCRKLEAENAEMKQRSKDDKGRGGAGEVEKLRAELDKKTKMIEKLKNERNDDEVGELKSQLQALFKENEKLKRSGGGGGGGKNDADTNKQLEKMAATIKAKDQLISEINDEKDELMALLEDDGVADKFKKMKKKSKEMKKTVKELKEKNENLEAELASLREENEQLRAGGDAPGKEGRELGGKHKKGCPHDCSKEESGKKCGKEKDSCPKDLRPLQELVREQEAHILDLQREVDTLRHAINDYQKELERLDPGCADTARFTGGKGIDRQRGDQQADNGRELEQTRRKLRSSHRRVAQLEKWLDEIYNDKNFEIVVKGAAFKGRKTTLALPEIPTADTARRGPPTRRQYLLAKGAEISAKTGRI